MIGTVVAHYKILEKVGEGGMGVVYKAHDTKLDRIVALKFLPHQITASDEDKSRFLQEAKAASAVMHANVCVIYDIQEHKGRQFIVMEFVEGKTLRELVPIRKMQEALDYAIQLGEALQEAHSKGIVHRDVKADNIMVTAKHQVKVMDFGLAKLKGSLKLTKTASTAGTISYMAPEQIQGGEVDARSDIFSFGVVLYEMLTGHVPFRGEHEAAMLYSIVHEEPTPLQRFVPDASSELVHIVNRALEKEPGDRYQSVQDMVIDLRRAAKQSGKLAHAGHVPLALGIAGTRARKHAGRYVVGGGMLLLVLTVAWYLYFMRKPSADSIAVLPFENVGGDPNAEYLSDGITEGLMNSLSQISHLRVMSRSSVFHYKGKDADPQKAGKELGVTAVLTGRVLRHGDELQISTELMDVATNSHVWGERYDRTMAGLLTAQEQVAKDVVRHLNIELAPADERKVAKHSTENNEAYQLYLKGRFHWNKRTAVDLHRAVEYFQQAIERDPGYGLAYAGLASALALIPEYSGEQASLYVDRALVAARKAIELDGALAEPHALLGLVYFEFLWKWVDAERELKRAVELDPNSPTCHQWYSGCLEIQGRFDEALAEIRRAQELDPLSPVIGTNVGEIYFYMRRYDSAIEALNKVRELDPDFPAQHLTLAQVYLAQKRFDEAIRECLRVREIVGADVSYGLGDLGYAYAAAGNRLEAKKILVQMMEFTARGFDPSAQIALIDLALGETDKAFEWLEKGRQARNPQLYYLKVDPYWRSLRGDPRYFALLKKIGLDK